MPIKSMTPDELLRQHEINGLLKELGVTDAQKDSARLVPLAGMEFDSWTVVSKANWPTKTASAKRAWCALKWLILDDPADSRDTKDAYKYVQDFVASKALVAGIKQLSKAKEAGAKASANSLENAKTYCNVVSKMKENNPKLTREAAVNKVKTSTGVKRSTGLKYIKMIFSDWDKLEKHK